MKYPISKEETAIILPVILEGRVKKDAHLVLDTGASFVTIPWKIALALNLGAETTDKRITITTASGTEIVPLVTMPAMTVLGHKLENVPIIVHDLPAKSRVDGLLGLSFLKHFRLTVDFKAGLAELE